MASKTHTIEVDAAPAIALQRKAASQGVSVSELVADMTALAATPVTLPEAEVAELDRQWASIKAGEATVPHEEVARWLRTWGTPDFNAAIRLRTRRQQPCLKESE
jgi:predicted transcriptional regulator